MAVTKFTQHELNQSLNVQTNSTSRLSPIWTAAWERVANLKSVYGSFKLSDDVWTLDAEFFAGRNAKKEGVVAARSIDFTKLEQSNYLDKTGVIRRLKRLTWIYLHTASGEMTTKVPNAKSLTALVNEIEPIIKVQLHDLDDECPDGPKLFANIVSTDFESHVPSGMMRNGIYVINKLLNEIDDHFRFVPKTHIQLKLSKTTNKTNDKNTVKKGAFDDVEITEILKQALYFSKLSNLVLDFDNWVKPHYAKAHQSDNDASPIFYFYPTEGSYKWNVNRTIEAKKRFEDEFYSGTRANLIKEGLLSDGGDFLYSFGDTNQYVNFGTFSPVVNKTLVNTIEISHRLLVAFFTGMRDQELYEINANCLRKLSDANYVQVLGYDLKGSDTLGGDERDWPLPKTCLEIIQRQQQIKERFFADNDYLFKVVWEGNKTTKAFAKNIGLDPNYMLKRMRPTIASIVMLATRSPLAVKSVLGHSEFEQTMGYAKSRKTLQEELVAQDSRINKALGKKIFDNVKRGNAPTKLATNILETAARFVGNSDMAKKAREIVNKYDIDDFAELLDMIDDNLESVEEHLGEQFDFVNSFTLCGAKRSDFNGACSAIPGVKNPSNCKSNCKYRQDLHQNLQYRAKQVEILIEDIADFEPDEPSYYHRVNQLLDFVWGFEGPLEKYKSDLRIQSIVYALDESDEGSEVRKKLAPNARQSLAQIMGEAA